MDKEKENIFVNTFIAKNKRERLKYELANPKKRDAAINRFIARAKDHILESKILSSGRNLIYEEGLFEIKEFRKPSKIYVICRSDDFDGKYLDFAEAMEIDIDYAPYILIVNDNIACIATEPMVPDHIKYILYNKG